MLHAEMISAPMPTYDAAMRQMVFDYVLQLADSTLLLSHRLSEWCGHGPILEQDMAMTNISLDLLGETRSLYQYAGELEDKGRSEDDLAFMRVATDYKNVLLTELPKGNFADTVMRQFLFDAYHYHLLMHLQQSPDERLAAIATKSFKEVSYHLRWSSEWVIRLGDGTAESKQKLETALQQTWLYTGELFMPTACESALAEAGIVPHSAMLQQAWQQQVEKVFEAATLAVPQNVFMQKGGKQGRHTEHLGFALAELQYMQRTYPGQEW